MTNRRTRINNQIDAKLIAQFHKLSTDVDIPMSRMIEYGIRILINKKTPPRTNDGVQKSINLTIQNKLWFDLLDYAHKHDYSLSSLLEEAIRIAMRKFKQFYKNV